MHCQALSSDAMFVAKKAADLLMFTATANIAVNWATGKNALEALFNGHKMTGWALIGLFTLAALFTVVTSALNLAFCKQDAEREVAGVAYVSIASVLTLAGLWKWYSK